MKALFFPMLAAALAAGSVSVPAQLQVVRQGLEGAGSRESGDRLGEAVALGDFNGDGFGDLATGVPAEKDAQPAVQSGAVMVNRGTKWGIGTNGAIELSPFDGGHLTDDSLACRFGAALAAGDFDGDGYDDLAVGAAGASVQRVFVYRGSPSGLQQPPVAWRESNFGGGSGAGDEFGQSLASGRLDSDAYDDLVIGCPGRSGGSGAIFVLRGSASGLILPASGSVITAVDFTFALSSGCRLGASLAIGNVAGFDRGDLLAGAPLNDADGFTDVGALVLIPGIDGGSGLSAGAAVRYLAGDILTPRSGSKFGTAVTTGDFRGDGGYLDFAASMVFGQAGEADEVIVWRGLIIPQFERVIDSPLPSSSVAKFGSALAAGDLDGDGRDELVVSAPDAAGAPASVFPQQGAVYFFNGGPTGPLPAPGTTLRESAFEDLPEASLEFGFALAAGRTTSNLRDSFFIGTPGKDGGSGEVVDYSPWRQPQNVRCANALCVNCDGDVTYTLRMTDQVRIASTTKIMTLLLACEAVQLPAGNPARRPLNLEYTIEPWTLAGFPNTPGGCSRYNFVLGDVVTFNDLIHATIMPSGNDAAMCIADVMFNEITTWQGTVQSAPVFVQRMNVRAGQIGMNDTLFTNPPGVDSGSPFSTAWDMYLLARTAMANPLFAQKIGITNYTLANTVGDGGANVRTINYNWLNNRKAANASVIGIKPGSTPGAGNTAVLAAPGGKPNELAYAAGFGWRVANTAGVGQDALIKFAQDSCPNPPPQTVGDLTAPLHPTHTGPLPAVIAGAVHDLRPAPTGGGWFFDLDVQAATADAADSLDVRLDYRAGVCLEASEEFTLQIEGLHGFAGIGIGNTEGQPAAPVDYSATSSGGVIRGSGVVLPVMGQADIAAATHDPGNPFLFTLKNTSAAKVFLSLNFQGLKFQPRFGRTAPFRHTNRFTLNREPVRQNFDATLTNTTGSESDIFFTIQSGIGDAIFLPAISLTNFSLTSGAAGGHTAMLDWTAPETYYSGFRILHSAELGPWTTLETVGPEGTGQLRTWTGPAPAGPRGFFRVEGLVP